MEGGGKEEALNAKPNVNNTQYPKRSKAGEEGRRGGPSLLPICRQPTHPSRPVPPFPPTLSGSIKAAGMCVALAERYSNAFLEYSRLEELEIAGGTAALRALVRCRLSDGNTPAASMGEDAGPVEYVWA